MLAVLSPAKKLNFNNSSLSAKGTDPLFATQANELVSILRKLDYHNMKALFPISEKLIQLNMDRYKKFERNPKEDSVELAVHAFAGDTYVGLDAGSFTENDIKFADRSLRIISGLYGLLKPTDSIQPYRLEMGTKLRNKNGEDLYAFWKNYIAKEVNKILLQHKDKTVINLASTEYFSAIDQTQIDTRILNTEFLEEKDGVLKVISFFAKKARGAMANFIVKNKIENVAELQEFNLSGYSFRSELSNSDKFVYSRKSEK